MAPKKATAAADMPAKGADSKSAKNSKSPKGDEPKPARSSTDVKSTGTMNDHPEFIEGVERFLVDNRTIESDMVTDNVMSKIRVATTMNQVFDTTIRAAILNMRGAFDFAMLLLASNSQFPFVEEDTVPTAEQLFKMEPATALILSVYDAGIQDNYLSYFDDDGDDDDAKNADDEDDK